MFTNYVYSENNELNKKAKEQAIEFVERIIETKNCNRLTTEDTQETAAENEICAYYGFTEQPVFTIFLGSVEDDIKPYYCVEDGDVEEFDDVKSLFEGLEYNFDEIVEEIENFISYSDEKDEEDEYYDTDEEEWDY